MKPREIDLIDLFVEILLQWRKIIVFMLVGAILFAGLGYVRSQKTYQEQKAEAERLEARLQELQELQTSEDGAEEIYPEKQWIEEQLEDEEVANVNELIATEKYCQSKQLYYEQSVLNQINALAVPTKELTFRISADTKEDAYDIQRAYEVILTSGDFYEYLAKKQKDISAAQIRELVAIERSSYGMLEGTELVNLSIINVDRSSCERLAEGVIKYVQEKQQHMVESLGKHEIELIHNSYAAIYRMDLSDKQKENADEVESLKRSLQYIRDEFSELQWCLYNYLTYGVAEGRPRETNTETVEGIDSIATELTAVDMAEKPQVDVRYIVLGMAMATFMCFFYYFVRYIFNTKVRDNDNVLELYGMPGLGHVPIDAKDKKFLRGVDKKILTIRYRGCRQFSQEEAIRLVVSAIKIAAKRKELQRVTLLGSGMTIDSISICQMLIDRLCKEGLTVNSLNDVMYDADNMEGLAEVEGAVLVGVVGETNYNELLDEKNLLVRQEIEQLGIILVG